MVDILHRIGVEAPLGQVYEAIATPQGVAGWWTTHTHGDEEAGGKLVVSFVDEAGEHIGAFDLELVDLDPAGRVTWLVTDGPEEWIGTHIRFELSTADGFTIVKFTHEGWAEPVDFMHHCSTKWATFLMSLKELVETGTGRPAPNDVRISDWH